MRKFIKWCLRIITGLLVFVLIGFVIIMLMTSKPMDVAMDVMDKPYVRVENRVIILEPENPHANVVFYPGGLVQAEAYLVFADALRDEGFRVFIPKMPLNLAIMNRGVYQEIYDNHPSTLPWIGIGHSLGGASLSFIAADDMMDGLVFLAAYPASSEDLSDLSMPVLSITASLDGVLDTTNYQKTMSLLPPHTMFLEIVGGNHANFGHYGSQRGDQEASMDRNVQQAMVVAWIIEYFPGP